MRGLHFGLLALTVVISGCEDTQQKQLRGAQPLIQAFQSGCASSKGRWTDAALSHSEALKDVFKTLEQESPCKNLVARLAMVQDYSQRINNLLEDQAFRDLRVKEENLKQLTIALSTATDPALQASLQSAIVQVQVEIAEARAKSLIAKDRVQEDRLAVFSHDLTKYTQQLLGDTASLNACLRESPEAAVYIATNMIAMGASLVSPIYGAGAAAVGTLINLGVESARTKGTEEAIYQLFESQMPTALACGLEAMTELHCQASETYDLVSLQVSEKPDPASSQRDSLEGLHLYSHGLPTLVEWMRELRNGVPPGDGFEADRQLSAKSKVKAIEDFDISMRAEIKKSLRIYDKEPNPDEKATLLVNFVRGYAIHLTMDMPTDYSKSFNSLTKNPKKMACWMIHGYQNPKCASAPETDQQNQTGQVDRYIRDFLLHDLMSHALSLENYWGSISQAALDRANAEYLDSVALDAEAILQKSRESTISKSSPYSVLTQIVRLLDAMAAHPNTPRDRLPLIRQTIRMIRASLDILDLPDPEENDTPAPGPSPSPSVSPSQGPILVQETPAQQEFRRRVRELYELYRLKDGPQFFVERVGMFVEWDLNDRMKRGEFSKDVESILRYLEGDLKARLLAPGHDNLQAVSDDLSSARQITEGNIEVFRGFFGNSLGNAIRMLKKRSEAPLEPEKGANRPNGQLLGKLCALVLVTAKTDQDWPEGVSWKDCENASYYYPGDPKNTLSISVKQLRESLKAAPDQSRSYRMCGYHRYVRETRIQEILREIQEDKFYRRAMLALKELFFIRDAASGL